VMTLSKIETIVCPFQKGLGRFFEKRFINLHFTHTIERLPRYKVVTHHAKNKLVQLRTAGWSARAAPEPGRAISAQATSQPPMPRARVL
jgi:hypothetical protein